MQNPDANSAANTDRRSDTMSGSGNMGSNMGSDMGSKARPIGSAEHDSSSLGDKVRGLASQAQEKTGEQLHSGLDAGKMRAASALHGVAESLLGGAQGKEGGIGGYIREAGDQVRRAADFLEHTDTRELSRRTEEYARRQPMIFLGGAFALGLIASRFFKSSHRRGSTGGMAKDASSYGRSQGGREASGSPYFDAPDYGARSESELPVRSYREPMPSAPTGISAAGASSRAGNAS